MSLVERARGVSLSCYSEIFQSQTKSQNKISNQSFHRIPHLIAWIFLHDYSVSFEQ